MTFKILIEFYRKERQQNRLWALNPRAFAGHLLVLYGYTGALAQASILHDQCSSFVCLYYRNVIGILQDLQFSYFEERDLNVERSRIYL